MFKIKHDLCPEITSNTFVEGENNLRYRKDFRTPPVKSVYRRTESIAYPGPKIWDFVLNKIFKKKASVNNFDNQLENGYQLIVSEDSAKFMLVGLLLLSITN